MVHTAAASLQLRPPPGDDLFHKDTKMTSKASAVVEKKEEPGEKAWPQQVRWCFFVVVVFFIALICSRQQQMILSRSCENCIFFLLSASQTLIIYLYIEYAKKSWGMLGKAK